MCSQNSRKVMLQPNHDHAEIRLPVNGRTAHPKRRIQAKHVGDEITAQCEPTSLSGEAGSREGGTWIKVTLQMRGQTIEKASINAYGCPYTLKVCEWLGGELRGRQLGADAALGETLAGGPRAWALATGTPEERLTRLLVIEDALKSALRHGGRGGYKGA